MKTITENRRIFSKTLSRVELFENTVFACMCGRTKTELFENADVTLSVPIHSAQYYKFIQELPGMKRKSWLKLLGVKFQEDATSWDIHIDNVLSKCTFLGYANFMDVLTINSIICLTRSPCPYTCMRLKFGVQLSSKLKISRKNRQVFQEGPQVRLHNKENITTILELIKDRYS